VDLLINKTGSVRATFFYSQIPDLTLGAVRAGGLNQRAGAKLSYRKEFTSLGDFLFGRKKAIKMHCPIQQTKRYRIPRLFPSSKFFLENIIID
jgi:hypothetical protein